MEGFDSKYANFPDWINGITHEIWEERGIDKLLYLYSDDIPVRSPSSIVIGNKVVIEATKATLSEFPDRQLLGEDVIWSGSPETGMLSSHRIISTASHLGDGSFGKATGKKITFRTIADCHAINNQINDEWLIRDQGSMARQLGMLPKDFARNQINNEGGFENCNQPFSDSMDKVGPYTGKGNNNEWGEKAVAILNQIMSGKDSVIRTQYDRGCHLEYPGGVCGHSYDDAEEFWDGLRSSMPSAIFTVEHQIGREDEHLPPRAAVRWKLKGKHDGYGIFGEPTGTDLYVMGVTHIEFGPWGLRREYTLFDETAIWKQIIIKTG
ncbi:MAG: nuclear transport factor 2 family protein [Rhodobacterales bacterium]|jgi:hypothetical protein|nr:nuclear transport factor 2 family protein [Gammaproteobacteria bacterium]MBT6893912.1 nuclear transport factor 2 family protein [Rhodobacterales bacterium]